MTAQVLKRKIRTAMHLFRAHGWRRVADTAVWRLRRNYFESRIRMGRAAKPRTVPTQIQFEASSNCNLRCPSCSLSREVNPGRHMSPGEFERFLDRLSFRPSSVSLNGIGEPLLNPHFIQLVDLLAERGIACSFFTNGTLLAPHVREQILARMNVNYVGISCDGASKETFEALRVGARFDVWKEFVKAFVKGAHSRAENPIETSMSTVVSRRNFGELSEIVELASELGFTKLTLADVVRNDEISAAMALSDADVEQWDTRALKAAATAAGVDLSINFRRSAKAGSQALRCFQPWEYMMVSAEGDVLPCCAIVGSDKAQVMGNLHRQSFDEVWRGEAFQRFRSTCADGTNQICQMCPFY